MGFSFLKKFQWWGARPPIFGKRTCGRKTTENLRRGKAIKNYLGSGL